MLDIGAGSGRLTGELERTGARVRAIELDSALAATLRRRFAAARRVEIIHGDALAAPLPREPFRVVANLPFGSTTAVLRRLLDDPQVPLTRADVIVEWDLARKRAAVLAEHAARRLLERLVRAGPRAAAAAGVLRTSSNGTLVVGMVRPVHVEAADRTRFREFVRSAFDRGLPKGRLAKPACRDLGVPPRAAARELDACDRRACSPTCSWRWVLHALPARAGRCPPAAAVALDAGEPVSRAAVATRSACVTKLLPPAAPSRQRAVLGAASKSLMRKGSRSELFDALC